MRTTAKPLLLLASAFLLGVLLLVGGCAAEDAPGPDQDAVEQGDGDTGEGTGDAPGGEGAEERSEGDLLVDARCTRCHSRTRVDAVQKDRAGWEATIDRMVTNGAELTDEERAKIIEYLLAR